MKRITTFAAILLASTASPALADEGFYQYPTVRGDVLVFASEGDLWRASRSGGSAIRLTNHQEEEFRPVLSPDGRWVSFNASYDSPNDIYVMPVAGGAPRRLTFEGGGVTNVGWTPDGKVIFASNAEGGGQAEILYMIDPAGGAATPIPLWRANDATYGSDGSLFFSRRGLRVRANDNAVQYRGGGMMQLWRWSGNASEEATLLLADFDAPVRNPMAHGGRIYFVSDRSGADAIWSVAEDGSGVTQHSQEFAFPILHASMDDGDIFLQNGADLPVFSTGSNTLTTLSIDIVSDREQTRPRTISNPLALVDAARISPSGERVAVTARGRVALGAPGQARRVEFSTPLDARVREAVESPDGERLFMILDRGDARDIFAMPADGSGEPVAITRGYDAHIWTFDIAPEGDVLIVQDKDARLQRVDVATGRVTLLQQNTSGADNAFSGVTFSPDGAYIAYAEASRENGGNTSDIFVQNVATGARVQATSGKYNDYAPAFAHDGGWLYFISDRNFNPTPGNPWGDRNMGVAFDDRGEIYALQLNPDAEFRFTERNELTRSADDDDAEAGDDADDGETEKAEGTPPANIVLAGLAERLYKVPGQAGIGRTLLATQDHLYTFRENNLVSIRIDQREAEEKTFAEGVRGVALSQDGKTLLVVDGEGGQSRFTLVPAAAVMPDNAGPNRVRLGDWSITVDPVAEWQQLFADAWRLHRDFAYDPALRGVDWNAVRAQHEPLLSRIGHRAELNTILGQMASQLGILHSQVRAGDLPSDAENGAMAFLGASYTAVAGGLRIDSIYRAEADLVALRPPLRRPGVDVRVGDVIQRVDGRPIASLADLRLALASKAGQQVRIDLSRNGAPTSAIVEPMTWGGARTAAYWDFVEGNRAAVNAAANGNIGYIHLRAMGSADIATFARDYFNQMDRDGLIIDVRNNGGGNIDSILIAQLMRRPWAFWTDPAGEGVVTTNMQNAFRGHIVVLIDERTYSDGETFAAGVKSLGLGPLVGTRTAGAGIWLSDRNRLIDNGAVRIAESAQYDLAGNWIIEGHGVGPDFEVENMPLARFNGEDTQLLSAIALLNQRIAEEPVTPLRPRPLPPLGTPGSDVRPLSE